MERKELKELKRFLTEQLIDCIGLEMKDDLTEEGRGMLLELKTIFEYMGWEKPKIKKMCKMNKEENIFWEKTYKSYVERGIHEDIINELVNKATKERFQRLRDSEVLY